MTQMIRKAEYCQHKGEKKRCDAYSFMSPMGQQKTGIIADPKQSPGECHVQFNGRVDEQALPIETNCIRSLSYDLNQSRALPSMPNHSVILASKMR